ncbi:MAG: DUF2997 domain-containing protein [Synechococcales cyanobacterium T60_A2020_003]|nr:DUF2997 domain-containing protein [Synechococcales cyanobacterium T60_A2020_003]
MAEYQRIEYRIRPDGTVTETVIDGSGTSCVQTTQGIESSLGAIASQELLPEYYDDGDASVYAAQTLKQTSVDE